MRRLPILSLALLTSVAIAACSSGAAPGWTYAPAPSATPAASGAPSGGAPSGGAPSAGAPSAGASVAPSSAASVAPSPSSGGSAAPSGLTVTAPVGATAGGFDPTTLETAAGTAFSLTFDNQDDQAPHNLILQNPDGSAVAVQGDTAFFTGPGQRVYQVPALTAGAYKYVCQVHLTTMIGTLTAQ